MKELSVWLDDDNAEDERLSFFSDVYLRHLFTFVLIRVKIIEDRRKNL